MVSRERSVRVHVQQRQFRFDTLNNRRLSPASPQLKWIFLSKAVETNAKSKNSIPNKFKSRSTGIGGYYRQNSTWHWFLVNPYPNGTSRTDGNNNSSIETHRTSLQIISLEIQVRITGLPTAPRIDIPAASDDGG